MNPRIAFAVDIVRDEGASGPGGGKVVFIEAIGVLAGAELAGQASTKCLEQLSKSQPPFSQTKQSKIDEDYWFPVGSRCRRRAPRHTERHHLVFEFLFYADRRYWSRFLVISLHPSSGVSEGPIPLNWDEERLLKTWTSSDAMRETKTQTVGLLRSQPVGPPGTFSSET